MLETIASMEKEIRTILTTIVSDLNGKDSLQNEAGTSTSQSKGSNVHFGPFPELFFEEENVCRVCLENDELEPLISPCDCKGTLAFVHASCLEHWLLESLSNQCELCQARLNTRQALQYTLQESLLKWLFNKKICCDSGNALGNFVATPFILFCFYFCIMIVDYYYTDNLNRLPIGAVTILLLFIMVVIMAMGYVTWMYFKLQLQACQWFRWWQSKRLVKIVLQEDKDCKPNKSSRSIH